VGQHFLVNTFDLKIPAGSGPGGAAAGEEKGRRETAPDRPQLDQFDQMVNRNLCSVFGKSGVKQVQSRCKSGRSASQAASLLKRLFLSEVLAL
jgi:hypothetical protein